MGRPAGEPIIVLTRFVLYGCVAPPHRLEPLGVGSRSIEQGRPTDREATPPQRIAQPRHCDALASIGNQECETQGSAKLHRARVGSYESCENTQAYNVLSEAGTVVATQGPLLPALI